MDHLLSKEKGECIIAFNIFPHSSYSVLKDFMSFSF